MDGDADLVHRMVGPTPIQGGDAVQHRVVMPIPNHGVKQLLHKVVLSTLTQGDDAKCHAGW